MRYFRGFARNQAFGMRYASVHKRSARRENAKSNPFEAFAWLFSAEISVWNPSGKRLVSVCAAPA
jgi:hypothetical protein